MPQGKESTFFVNPYDDPVIIQVRGRASFHNSGALRDFFARLIEQGRRHFILDFCDCTAMDSTFLGIAAGAALDLSESKPEGSLTLCRLSERNLELVLNLGLHRIAQVVGANGASESSQMVTNTSLEALQEDSPKSHPEQARMALEAHEALIQCDESNRQKFQDVVAFLRNQADNA
jgi:anti-sigma B factor antagonist